MTSSRRTEPPEPGRATTRRTANAFDPSVSRPFASHSQSLGPLDPLSMDFDILAQVRDAVVMMDMQGMVTYWNQGAERLLGWPAHEMLGKPMVHRYPEHVRDQVAEQLAAIGAGQEWDGEFIDYRPDGSTIWADGRVRCVQDAEGRPVGILGIAHDITARKESESLLRAVIEGTDDAVFVKDTTGRYLLFNEAAAKFVGREAADVLGRIDADLFDAEGARLVRDRDLRVMETGQIETEEERLTAAGSTRVYLAMKAPFRDLQGRIAGTIGISRDITERKQNEDTMRLQSLVLDSMNEGVIVGDGDGRICYTNPAQDAMFGYARGELLQQQPQRLYADKPFEATTLARVLAHDTGDDVSWSGEVTSIRRDGTQFMTFARISTIHLDSRCYWAIIHEDITERKAWQEQLHHVQKMEAIGRLAGGIAHDFNNLLTVIAGATDLLMAQTAPDDVGRPLLQAIRDAGARAAALTRQLLAFSRRQAPAPTTIDLNQIVQRLTAMMAPTIGEQITWINHLTNEPIFITADASQVEQALMNLILNARDAMLHQGCLTIRTRIITIGSDHQASMESPKASHDVKHFAELDVSDTGHGMSAEVQSRMFEPFYTTKGLGRGTGLGLAVVHGFIEQAGGEVAVESTLGVGTTFHLRFPIAAAPATTAIPSESPTTSVTCETVLVVDREPSIRQVTRRTLEGIGYRILEAHDAAHAIDIVEAFQGDIHLIIADLRLPTIDGRQLSDAIRVRDPKVRSLYLMPPEEAEFASRHDLPPGRNLLSKPFSAQQLVERVRHVLDDSDD